MAIDLAKKVGPMPLGAWIAVVAVGLGIAYYTSRNPPASGGDEIEQEFVEDTSTDPGVGTGGFTFTPPPVVNPSVPKPVDNEEWAVLAINYLTSAGYDAAWANAAINKALFTGEKMSVREWSLWRLALLKLGSPPYPVDVRPPDSSPKPKKPDPKKPKPKPQPKIEGRWYRVRAAPLPGSTLRGIAKMAYGDPDKWRRIYTANRKGKKLPNYGGRERYGQISNPNLLRPGSLLYIPRG